MKNLKEETLKIMKNHGKTIEDVTWIGCEDFAIPIQEFWNLQTLRMTVDLEQQK